ncbi:MAG: DNA polymerase III subunit delta' [Proteobacteria bacterium]|nr:DNA polymerase III subunit delta' [Pseudomonadota bacterium]MBU1686287.1 DNA polymerase III subunit delta' [Pseudomonadota bacterium]
MFINDVIGQDKAKRLLRQATAHQRLSHAYLFRGPSGVGRKTLARAFGVYLNCLAPTPDQDGCGQCRSCRKFASSNHPDLLTIEPDGAGIKINQIRELKHQLGFPPFESTWRVVLITDVNTMRREAANSLLKTLEEPPPHNLLILIGDEGSTILPTITSRCQIIPCRGLPQQLVAEKLRREDNIPPEMAATLAAITGGSPGQARIMAAGGLLGVRRNLITTLLPLKTEHPETPGIIFELAERCAALKDDLPDLLDLVKIWFHELDLAAKGVGDRLLSHDLLDQMEAGCHRWIGHGYPARLRLLEEAKKQLARNCNRALVCEVLFFNLLDETGRSAS